jgi:hypothetical protein
MPLRGFGSSDGQCATHLYWFEGVARHGVGRVLRGKAAVVSEGRATYIRVEIRRPGARIGKERVRRSRSSRQPDGDPIAQMRYGFGGGGGNPKGVEAAGGGGGFWPGRQGPWKSRPKARGSSSSIIAPHDGHRVRAGIRLGRGCGGADGRAASRSGVAAGVASSSTRRNDPTCQHRPMGGVTNNTPPAKLLSAGSVPVIV